MAAVLEYRCPCCNDSLVFSEDTQNLRCGACGNEFDIETVREYHDIPEEGPDFTWEDAQQQPWNDPGVYSFECCSCGGQILCEGTTAATFCPYCDNPAVMPARVSGMLKPDAVIPFKTGKEDAQEAFLKLCKGKPLLPGDFTAFSRLEKITGLYVPFWLYNCHSDQHTKYRGTRVHRWSDSNYNYKKTDYYLLTRAARADFSLIPLDGSRKMEDHIMESIEPFDYGALMDFDTAYLSGFLADKYDVEARDGEARVRSRVGATMDARMYASCIGYASVIPTHNDLRISHSKAKYVLLPVWMLTTRYKDKTYTFAMNGQTGKMTGSLPISAGRAIAWFSGICAAVTALVCGIQLLAMTL